MKQYCITGINKLTRERDVVSNPCTLANATAILNREKAKAPSRREYIHLKIQVYPVAPKRLEFKD